MALLDYRVLYRLYADLPVRFYGRHPPDGAIDPALAIPGLFIISGIWYSDYCLGVLLQVVQLATVFGSAKSWRPGMTVVRPHRWRVRAVASARV